MSRALVSPAIVAGLFTALAVLAAPGRRDELPDGGDGAKGGERADGTEGRNGVTGYGASWSERPAPPDAAMPDEVNAALVLLALGYRSGLPTWEVLGAVADVLHGSADGHKAPVVRDLRQVAAALRWGASDDEAWASVGQVWSAAGRAVAIAHRAGIAPGPLLLTAAEDLRRESLEQVELAGARVGVRLVAPLGLVLLPAFCLTTVVPLVVALAGQMLTG
ncbi:MAG TPA: type II secretion system F family protein [Intrasporangium sp.]|uniref:type II secretion system F family protein n=1 Tax=Intrasporangium sp. TaxID=1925024 RepID=UPI002F92C204